ncbi:STAS domain-containing protein [Geodermatophilus sp. SYSU D01186]
MDSVGAGRDARGTAMTEIVDWHGGSVRVSGDLTAQGADLVRGTVECLRRSGHSVVILDLGDVHAADAAGLDDLRALQRAVAADGGELLLLSPSAVPAP